MKNLIKSTLYTSAGLLLIGLNSVNAAISPDGSTTIDSNIITEGSADTVIQGWLGTALGFLYLVAVLLGIWGGFNILTAAGDEEKVKKGKTVLIQAAIGIVVIFLAGSIVQWLFGIIQ